MREGAALHWPLLAPVRPRVGLLRPGAERDTPTALWPSLFQWKKASGQRGRQTVGKGKMKERPATPCGAAAAHLLRPFNRG